MDKMELRINPVEIEANKDGSMNVSGYVNETEQYSQLLGRTRKFREKISKGAFQRALERAKEVHFLAEHDGHKILASTRNGSLKLTEDERGLYFEATIVPTSWGKDYYELIKSKVLNNMSFGFRAIKDNWKRVDNYFERTVEELDLVEISVVRDPAYTQSTISARGIDVVEEIAPEEKDYEFDIHIRSTEDINLLAEKLFEMLQTTMKPKLEEKEEKYEEEPEDIDAEKQDDVKEDDDGEKKSESDDDKVDEKDIDEEQDDQPIDEDEVDKNRKDDKPVKTEAEKLREFINNYKI